MSKNIRPACAHEAGDQQKFANIVREDFGRSRMVRTLMCSFPGLLPPPALSQRMGSITSYMSSEETGFYLSRMIENATTIEDIFVIMARLNFGDMAHDMNKVIWKIVVNGQETEFCLFIDMCMPDIRRIDDVKDRILLPLRYITQKMVIEGVFHRHPNVNKILLGDNIINKWWNKMDYEQVWKRIKTHLPCVEYTIQKGL